MDEKETKWSVIHFSRSMIPLYVTVHENYNKAIEEARKFPSAYVAPITTLE